MTTTESQAWETDNGDVVVWGTHDHDEAAAAFDDYLHEVYDREALEAVDLEAYDFAGGRAVWADPAALAVLEGPWPQHLITDDPVDGWIPVLLVAGP